MISIESIFNQKEFSRNTYEKLEKKHFDKYFYIYHFVKTEAAFTQSTNQKTFVWDINGKISIRTLSELLQYVLFLDQTIVKQIPVGFKKLNSQKRGFHIKTFEQSHFKSIHQQQTGAPEKRDSFPFQKYFTNLSPQNMSIRVHSTCGKTAIKKYGTIKKTKKRSIKKS